MSPLDMNAKWNYEPCRADKGTVVCGKVDKPTSWCKPLEGRRVKCVRVDYRGEVFFLGDDDGSGSYKVFKTEGGPFCAGHKSLPVDDPDTFEAYNTDLSGGTPSARKDDS